MRWFLKWFTCFIKIMCISSGIFILYESVGVNIFMECVVIAHIS